VSTDLATVDTATGELVHTDTPTAIVEKAGVIASTLKDVIDRQGFSRKIGQGEHIEVAGWQVAGMLVGAFGGEAVHVEIVSSERLDREGEIAYRAVAEARTISGRVVGRDEGLCSSLERNWRGRDEFAIKSMASTRAEGRAYAKALRPLMSMAGYNATPAEEMGHEPAGLPSWAQGAGDSDIAAMARQLVAILTALGAADPAKMTGKIGQAVMDDCDNTVPGVAVRLAHLIAEHIPAPDTGAITENEQEAA
jgi:hypothetical protein